MKREIENESGRGGGQRKGGIENEMRKSVMFTERQTDRD